MCLEQVRAFTKKTGHKPDFSDPVVLSADRGGITVDHLCARLHATLAKQFHYALVWGTSAKHYPQRYPGSQQAILQPLCMAHCNARRVEVGFRLCMHRLLTLSVATIAGVGSRMCWKTKTLFRYARRRCLRNPVL